MERSPQGLCLCIKYKTAAILLDWSGADGEEVDKVRVPWVRRETLQVGSDLQ